MKTIPMSFDIPSYRGICGSERGSFSSMNGSAPQMLTDNKASKTGVKSPAERHSQRRSVAFYQGFGEVSL